MGKIAIFFRIIFSIILGFLPSFAFIWIFLSYGSPFSNYINFMSNFQVSKWAWILAAVISFLVFLIWTVAKSKSPSKKYVLAIIIFLLLIGGFVVFLQAYMYINFFLGGDTLVHISADKPDIFFADKTEESITFATSAVLTPFCTAECTYSLFDLSQNQEIEKGSFTLTSVLPKTKTFILKRENIPNGQSIKEFTVACRSKKTTLCYTLEKENKKSMLITVNYGLTQQQRDLFEPLKAEAILLLNNLSRIESKFKADESNLLNLNRTVITDSFLSSYASISGSMLELNSLIAAAQASFENQDFTSLTTNLNIFKTKLYAFQAEENTFDSNIQSAINNYNQLVEKISASRYILQAISADNLTEADCNSLNLAVKDFNSLISLFREKNSLDRKESEANEVYAKALSINHTLDAAGTSCSLNESLTDLIIQKIKPADVSNITIDISFKEPDSICCYLSICKKCSNSSNANYPVIFLHGHSVSSRTPADYSLDTFSDIKKRLSAEGFVDAGTLVISHIAEEAGLWGKSDFPFMMTSSYFFDLYKSQEGNYLTQSSKADSIDTYALRLKDIIEQAKYKTGKDKVIIIAHSMGGVVSRRYIQIFGKSSIDKMILLTVPNKGINSKTTDICKILGSTAACRNLNKDSMFMNKLNNAPTEQPEVYNVIGIGCKMGAETGDGIVENSSQYLDYATNYYVQGTCDELTFNFLHGNILRSDLYPQVYEIIKQILKQN